MYLWIFVNHVFFISQLGQNTQCILNVVFVVFQIFHKTWWARSSSQDFLSKAAAAPTISNSQKNGVQENNPYEKVTTDWMFGVLLSPMSSGLQQP
jgi:hypothetical protein